MLYHVLQNCVWCYIMFFRIPRHFVKVWNKRPGKKPMWISVLTTSLFKTYHCWQTLNPFQLGLTSFHSCGVRACVCACVHVCICVRVHCKSCCLKCLYMCVYAQCYCYVFCHCVWAALALRFIELLMFYCKMYWMFYVNDEPEGKFTTQRHCIIL